MVKPHTVVTEMKKRETREAPFYNKTEMHFFENFHDRKYCDRYNTRSQYSIFDS